MRPEDKDFFKEIIYIALWDPPGAPRRPRKVLQHPMVKEYYEKWGKPDDIAFIATVDDQPVGMVTSRIKSCVTEEYKHFPELGIGLLPQFQSRGIGGLLMKTHIDHCRVRKYPGLRLGVHPENRIALRLYNRFGFEVYAQPERHYPQMVLRF